MNIPNTRRVTVVWCVRAPVAKVVRPVATAAFTPLFSIKVVFSLKSTYLPVYTTNATVTAVVEVRITTASIALTRMNSRIEKKFTLAQPRIKVSTLGPRSRLGVPAPRRPNFTNKKVNLKTNLLIDPCASPREKSNGTLTVRSGRENVETLIPKLSVETTYVAIAALTPVFTTILTDRESASKLVPIKSIITMAAVEEDRTRVATNTFASIFAIWPAATVAKTS